MLVDDQVKTGDDMMVLSAVEDRPSQVNACLWCSACMQLTSACSVRTVHQLDSSYTWKLFYLGFHVQASTV